MDLRTCTKKIDCFKCLVFLYFLTLHADKLGFTISGFNLRFNNFIALLLVILFFTKYRLHTFAIDRQFARGLALITLSTMLSCCFSPFKGRCLFFLGWYVLTILCYVLLPYFLVKKWEIQKVFSLYCISFIPVGIYALGQLIFSWFGLNDPFAHQRLLGNIVRPNAFSYEPSFYALYMTPFIMMCNFHYVFTPERPLFCFKNIDLRKIIFLNSLFLVSFTASAILACILFFLSSFLLINKCSIKKRIFKLMGMLSLSLSIIWIFYPTIIKVFFLKFIFNNWFTQASFYERLGGIHNAWKVFLQYPLCGIGLGGYSPYLMNTWLRGDSTFTFFPVYFVDLSDCKNLIKIFEPANVSTEILASLGLLGLSAFIYITYIFFKRAIAAYKRSDMQGINVALSLIIMLSILQINQGLLRTYVWVHFSLVFAYLEHISYSINDSEKKLEENRCVLSCSTKM